MRLAGFKSAGRAGSDGRLLSVTARRVGVRQRVVGDEALAKRSQLAALPPALGWVPFRAMAPRRAEGPPQGERLGRRI